MKKFNRCSGFVYHKDTDSAYQSFHQSFADHAKANLIGYNYSITRENYVRSLINEVKETEIRKTVTDLTQFHNRYFKSQTGVQALEWLKNKWTNLTKDRNDVSLSYFRHDGWPQPSLILTIKGKSQPDDIVVIGGHADSIAGFWNRENARAPGADDNASGIATITEVLRLLVLGNYQPS